MANSKYASALHHVKQARTTVEEQALRIQTAYTRAPKTDVGLRTSLSDTGKALLKIDISLAEMEGYMTAKVKEDEAKPQETVDERAGRSKATS